MAVPKNVGVSGVQRVVAGKAGNGMLSVFCVAFLVIYIVNCH